MVKMNRNIIANSQNDITFNYKVILNYVRKTREYHMRRFAKFGTICTIKKNVKNTHGTVV